MRKYLKIISNVIKESTEYRINHLMSILVIVFPLIFALLLWDTIFNDVDNIAGYTKVKIITYYILSVLIVDLTYVGVNYEIANDIREGRLTYYLAKPISYIGHSFAIKIGNNLPYFSISLVAILIYTVLILKVFYIQTNPIYILMFVVSFFFAFILGFILTFTISLIAFWLEDISSVQTLCEASISILSGALLPLSLFPPSLQNIFHLLPFKYLLNFPIEIYLGNLSIDIIFQGFITQIFWIVFFYLFHIIIWKRGLKQYQAYGG